MTVCRSCGGATVPPSPSSMWTGHYCERCDVSTFVNVEAAYATIEAANAIDDNVDGLVSEIIEDVLGRSDELFVRYLPSDLVIELASLLDVRLAGALAEPGV